MAAWSIKLDEKQRSKGADAVAALLRAKRATRAGSETLGNIVNPSSRLGGFRGSIVGNSSKLVVCLGSRAIRPVRYRPDAGSMAGPRCRRDGCSCASLVTEWIAAANSSAASMTMRLISSVRHQPNDGGITGLVVTDRGCGCACGSLSMDVALMSARAFIMYCTMLSLFLATWSQLKQRYLGLSIPEWRKESDRV